VDLAIYLDEAGIAPRLCTDEIFLMAAVGVDAGTQFPPTDHRLDRSRTLELIDRARCHIECRIVRADAEYQASLEKKVRIYRFVVREDARIDKMRDWFFKPEDVNHRNLVWGACAAMTIGSCIAMFVLRRLKRLSSLSVFMDQKTLNASTERLVRSLIDDAVDVAREVFRRLEKNKAFNLAARRNAKDALWMVNVRPDARRIQFSDQRPFAGQLGGLALADAVSSNLRAELISGEKDLAKGISKILGATNWLDDATAYVSRVPSDLLANWARERGMAVPSDLS
jgi:hypothetical protein